jgi:endoglycosylceramidase
MVLGVNLLITLLISLISSQTAATPIQVNTTTRMLTDPSGRERIFHGVNVVYKLAPYHPPLLSGFQPQLSFGDKDVEFLVQNGFNMVRLYVSWHGLEAEKDNYNSSYLDVLSLNCIAGVPL